MKKVNAFLMIVFLVISINIQARDFEDLMDKGFNIMLKSEYNANFWIPTGAYNLQQITTGPSTLKLEGALTTSWEFLPVIRANWETNMISNSSKEMIMRYNTSTSRVVSFLNKANKLISGYNKFMFLTGFGTNEDSDFNPFISNGLFDFQYSSETFVSQTTPKVFKMNYVPYEGSTSIPYYFNDTLTLCTKFEEFSGMFNMHGQIILPSLFFLMFNGEMLTMDDSSGETKLGLYYSTFQKPYTIAQTYSSGDLSGNRNDIYNSKFRAIGLVEEFTLSNSISYFSMRYNLGVSWIKLNKNLYLQDTSAPIFFDFKINAKYGLNIPLGTPNLLFGLFASADYGFVLGGDFSSTNNSDDYYYDNNYYNTNYYDDTENKPIFEMKSFINGDLILKLNASLTLNF